MADNELLPEAVLPDLYQARAKANSKRYHVGLVPNGPAWNQTFAGISFPVYTSRYDDSDNEFKQEGAILDLTAEQCKAIKDAIRHRVVRWSLYPRAHKKAGQKMSATIHDVRSKGFEPEKTDEPLVKWVYFKEAPAEFTQPAAPVAAFEELDRAIKAAEKTESEKQSDPEDAATRAKHAALRKSGGKLSADGAL